MGTGWWPRLLCIFPYVLEEDSSKKVAKDCKRDPQVSTTTREGDSRDENGHDMGKAGKMPTFI